MMGSSTSACAAAAAANGWKAGQLVVHSEGNFHGVKRRGVDNDGNGVGEKRIFTEDFSAVPASQNFE